MPVLPATTIIRGVRWQRWAASSGDAEPPSPPPPPPSLPPSPPDLVTALAAIENWWAATAAAQALTADGRIWLIEAPEETALAYATYVLVSEVATVWTTGYPIMLATVQISLHASTAAYAAVLAGQLTALLGKSPGQPAGAPLTVGSSDVMHCIQDDFSLHLGEGLGPDGQDCWVAIVTFEIPYTP